MSQEIKITTVFGEVFDLIFPDKMPILKAANDSNKPEYYTKEK